MPSACSRGKCGLTESAQQAHFGLIPIVSQDRVHAVAAAELDTPTFAKKGK